MSKQRLLIVADGLDLETIVRVLAANGVSADRLHAPSILLTKEMAAIGVCGDLPDGRLMITAIDRGRNDSSMYDGVTGTWNNVPVCEGP